MIAIGLSAMPIFVRVRATTVMARRVEDYVEAARAMGNPRWRIALFHILPNIMPALLVQATLSIAAAIIAEAALSFLGLGQQPPAPSWGGLLIAAQRLLANAPWMAVSPGSRSFSWCSRSIWSATACATRWIRGSGRRKIPHGEEALLSAPSRPHAAPLGLILRDARRRAPQDEGLDHHLPHHSPAIHLILKIDHRRPGKMPGQTRTRGAAANERIGKDVMEIVDGVGLHSGSIVPAEPEFAHAPLHHARDVTDLLRNALRADITVAHRTFGIARIALLRTRRCLR